MTHERANRIVWIGWLATLPFAYVAPIMRPLTGVRGSGRWAVFATVGVMLVALFLIRKDRRALFLSIDMSASGLAIGATGGFVSAALLSGRALAAILALKWAIGAAFLTWLFRRELHAPSSLEEIPLDPEDDPVFRVRREFGIPADQDVGEAIDAMPEARRQEVARFVEGEMARASAEMDRIIADSNRRIRRTWIVAAPFLLAALALLALSFRR